MLLRTINKAQGLVNGTRLIVTHQGRNLIHAKMMSGPFSGDNILIPRVTLIAEADIYPFDLLHRRQFPIRLSFSRTITKSQGQTYTRIALYLPEPVFSHGQLYVSISRVRSPRELGIMILQTKTQGSFPLYPHRYFTRNVIFKENLWHCLCMALLNYSTNSVLIYTTNTFSLHHKYK